VNAQVGRTGHLQPGIGLPAGAMSGVTLVVPGRSPGGRRGDGSVTMTGTQEPVVTILAEEWDAIDFLGQGLGEGEWELPSECPGWTVRDVLSHLIGIERSLLGDPSPPPLAELPPHVENEIGARNEAWVAPRRSLPGPVVLQEFREVSRRRLAQLRAFPGSRYDEVGPSPIGEVQYREFMHVRVMDSWVHEQDIRIATARPGHDSGPAAQLSLDRLCAGIPFVVGKQAGAPDGVSVRFELRGSLPRRIDVAVRDGRAKVVPSVDGTPTVALGMDVEVFWRLTCGRVDGGAARLAGLVDVEGDSELASRVVDAMAFMI
jgi:uncharacterized protein (TIGR03083 family)